MIVTDQDVTWVGGAVDGIVRDLRVPQPADGLLSSLVALLGPHPSGPAVKLSIERRLYPRKAPVHLHKADTFRMALEAPIVVGRTSYDHGRFRLQAADTYYGPEYWDDKIGTNQMLVIADRRGSRVFCTTAELQQMADEARRAEAEAEEAFGFSQLPRDAEVDHVIADSTGAGLHAGHWDGGFDEAASWPRLSDGTRLEVILMGDRRTGPLLLCFDRPAGAAIPAFTSASDLLRLVVDGTTTIGDRLVPRRGFRVQQEGTRHGASVAGDCGSKELWLVGDRSTWAPDVTGGVLADVVAEVERVVAGIALAV